MSAPLPRVIRNGMRLAARSLDAIDDSAEREGIAAEFMADLHDMGTPLLPHVAMGLQISAAVARHEALPSLYADPLAQPQKRPCHTSKRKAVQIVARAMSGGIGTREIVTSQDKTRRELRAMARQLGVMLATTTDKSMLEAIAIARVMLRKPSVTAQTY